jgi:hypothetical protein
VYEPEKLYQRTETDAPLPPLQLWMRKATSGLVTAALSVINIRNDDAARWVVIHNIWASASVVGAEFVTGMEFQMVTPLSDATPQAFDIKSNFIPGAAAVIQSLDREGPLYLPPGYAIQLSSQFSGAVQNKTSLLNVLGVLIPVGTLRPL